MGLPIVDDGLQFRGAGNVDCTTAAQLNPPNIATPLTTAAYMIVTNLDATAVVYLGKAGVTGDTDGEALPAGQTRRWRSANPSLEYAIGSATVNVSIRQ